MTTEKKQHIHISIAFGDALLPVIECEDGHDRVPLKTIVKEIGAQWEGQRRKVQPEKYPARRFGVITTTLKCGSLPYLCIRLDWVTALKHPFFDSIRDPRVTKKAVFDCLMPFSDQFGGDITTKFGLGGL